MIGCLRRTPGKSWQVLEVLLLCQIQLCSPWFQQWLLRGLLSLSCGLGHLRLEPSVCHHGVAVCRQEGTDPCRAGKGSSPSRVQMVQAGQVLAALTRGWNDSKAVGDANLWNTGSPALPEPASHSGQQQQLFWLYLRVPYGTGIHLWGGGVHSMGDFIH